MIHPTDTPQQVLERVAALVAAGADPAAAGPLLVAKLRLAGVYDDRQEGFFMLRTRIPGGRLGADQADVVAGVAERHSVRPDGAEGPDRFVEVTTRQGIQLHWIRFEDLPEIWLRYGRVGLTSLEACGDTLRNVTCCPLAGLDPDEAVAAAPVVAAVNRAGLAEPELSAFLPRKFKVAVTGCRTDCVLAGLHDLAFTPARRGSVSGFNVLAGGGLSDYPRLASPLDLFVEPAQVPDVVRAALLFYRDQGDVEYKVTNLFRRPVPELGPEQVGREVRARLSFRAAPAGEGLGDGRAEDHLGVRPERRPGRVSVGLCVPRGRLVAAELAELARLAREYGDGELRLTQRQDVVLASVREDRLPELLDAPLLARLRPEPDPFDRAIVACTSTPFCKFGIVDAKARGAELAEYLRRTVPRSAWPRLSGLRVHVSGCKASCAQTQAGHVGLRGAIARDERGLGEGFDLAIGGDPGAGRLGAWAAAAEPVEDAFAHVSRLVQAFADDPRGLAAAVADARAAALEGNGP